MIVEFLMLDNLFLAKFNLELNLSLKNDLF